MDWIVAMGPEQARNCAIRGMIYQTRMSRAALADFEALPLERFRRNGQTPAESADRNVELRKEVARLN
jgi:hypothetical protein